MYTYLTTDERGKLSLNVSNWSLSDSAALAEWAAQQATPFAGVSHACRVESRKAEYAALAAARLQSPTEAEAAACRAVVAYGNARAYAAGVATLPEDGLHAAPRFITANVAAKDAAREARIAAYMDSERWIASRH